MPGDNCSIYGCPVSRSKKYKDIGILKVPSGKDDYSVNMREKLTAIITRDREIDDFLRGRIKKESIY